MSIANDDDSIESIHRRVLEQLDQQFLVPPKRPRESNTAVGKKLSTLNALKRKRISLFAEMEEKRKCRMVSLSDDLHVRRQRMQQLQTRPYLRFAGSNSRNSLSFLIYENDVSATTATNLPKVDQMHKIRLSRMLTAAYRLAGISASLEDEEGDVLSLQLDVSVDGTFVACYHIFFQLVVASSAAAAASPPPTAQGKQQQSLLYLRLMQHTLPKPLSQTVSQIVGESSSSSSSSSSPWLIGPLLDDEEWPRAASSSSEQQQQSSVFQELARRSRRLYAACYSYTVRQQALEQLQQLDKRTARSTTRQFYVRRAVLNEKELSFRLRIKGAHVAGDVGVTTTTTLSLSICLHWDSMMQAKPSSVTVSSSSTRRGGKGLSTPARSSPSHNRREDHGDDNDSNDEENDVAEISDDENEGRGDDTMKELTRLATHVFGRLPIPQAIEHLVSRIILERGLPQRRSSLYERAW